MKTHLDHQTKRQFRHNISIIVISSNSMNWMRPLSDESKLQIDEMNNKN